MVQIFQILSVYIYLHYTLTFHENVALFWPILPFFVANFSHFWCSLYRLKYCISGMDNIHWIYMFQGGRSCAEARGRGAEKFGLRRKFEARKYTILSRIKISRNLHTVWRSLGKNSAFLGQKQCFLGKKCMITWHILHILLSCICKIVNKQTSQMQTHQVQMV